MTRFFVLLICFAVGACRNAPKTTQLQGIDLLETTEVMAASLESSLFFQECSAEEDGVLLSYQKAENRSADLLTPSEQWLFVERVIDSEMIKELRNKYDVVVVRSAQKDNLAGSRTVTHLMTAVVTTITRDEYKDRTDAYKCQYEVTNLQTGEVVWSDSFEIKRIASGISWD